MDNTAKFTSRFLRAAEGADPLPDKELHDAVAKGVICSGPKQAALWVVYQVSCLDRETGEELMVAFPRKGVFGVLETQRGGPKIYRTLATLVAQLRDAVGRPV